jgi:hypothetical protein
MGGGVELGAGPRLGLVSAVAPAEELDGWVANLLRRAPLPARALKEAVPRSATELLATAFATRGRSRAGPTRSRDRSLSWRSAPLGGGLADHRRRIS